MLLLSDTLRNLLPVLHPVLDHPVIAWFSAVSLLIIFGYLSFKDRISEHRKARVRRIEEISEAITKSKEKQEEPLVRPQLDRIISEIQYNEFDGKIVIRYLNRRYKLHQFSTDSDSRNVFEFALKRPLERCTRKEIQEFFTLSTVTPFTDTFKRIGFNDILRRLFVKVSNDTVYIRPWLVETDFSQAEIAPKELESYLEKNTQEI